MSLEKLSNEAKKAMDAIHQNLGKAVDQEEMARRKNVEHKAKAYLGSNISQLVSFRPIFGTVFLYLNKTISWDMPTMGVGPIRRVDLALYYNPDFVISMNPNQLKAVLIHEALHILLHHIDRGKNYGYNPKMFNIAADMAINTHIKNLPEFAVLPKQIGQPNDLSAEAYYKVLKSKAVKQPGGQEQKQQGSGGQSQQQQGQGQGQQAGQQGQPQEQGQNQGQQGQQGQSGGENQPGNQQGQGGGSGHQEGSFIKHSGGHQGSNRQSGSWQTGQYTTDPNKGSAGGGTGDLGDLIPDLKGKDLMDDHSQWDEMEEDVIREKIRDIAKRAISEQEQQKGWSDIGSGLAKAILDANKPVINWKRELRWFINKMVLRGRRSTRQRPNRRFGFIQPGNKKTYTSKLLIAVDVSGSVSDREYVDFMTEINGMIDYVEVHVIFFDTVLHGKYDRSGPDIEPIPFDKKLKKVTRKWSGGTNFHIVFDYARDKAYDGLIMMTDGYAPFPDKPKYRCLWALSEQGKGVHPPFGKRLVIEPKNK